MTKGAMTRPISDRIQRMIRVDQAGEFGAVRIYAGQLAVMGDRGPNTDKIREMAAQPGWHIASEGGKTHASGGAA